MKPSSEVRNPEITVLMSCYNASRWLQGAIDSVLTQTFENFEFIIIDDGSTDETLSILQNYRDQDTRIIVISKPNTGLADSLNVGIAQARGTWIARLDADDLCEPKRLEEQINFVRNHPDVVLLGTGFVEIDEQGRIVKKHRYPSKHRVLVRNLGRLRPFFPHSSALYRLAEARRVKGYDIRFRRAGDWRLWLTLAFHGRLACLPSPLVQIRKHSGQISHDNNGKRQICDSVAATICYWLQRSNGKGPSENVDDEWITFLAWIENRLEELGVFERRKAWADARTAYFTAGNKLTGAFHFGFRLLQSGHFSTLVWQKLFGTSLPKRLAKEWIKRSCAV